jgi:hypothetical protein
MTVVRRTRLSAADTTAAVLLVVGIVAIALGVSGSSRTDWLPNIATESIAIAVTIAVVDRPPLLTEGIRLVQKARLDRRR